MSEYRGSPAFLEILTALRAGETVIGDDDRRYSLINPDGDLRLQVQNEDTGEWYPSSASVDTAFSGDGGDYSWSFLTAMAYLGSRPIPGTHTVECQSGIRISTSNGLTLDWIPNLSRRDMELLWRRVA